MSRMANLRPGRHKYGWCQPQKTKSVISRHHGQQPPSFNWNDPKQVQFDSWVMKREQHEHRTNGSRRSKDPILSGRSKYGHDRRLHNAGEHGSGHVQPKKFPLPNRLSDNAAQKVESQHVKQDVR